MCISRSVAANGSGPVALSGRVAWHLRATNLREDRCTRPVLCRPGRRGGRREAYIPTQHPPPGEKARVPCPHEHPSRPQRAEEPSRQGPRPALGLIARIRGRHDFARLARDGTRIRGSALWCTWCPEPHSTATRVGYAISRAYGPAVRRNRLRRRLRATLAEFDGQHPLPAGMMIIGPHRHVSDELTFDRVAADVATLVERIRTSAPLDCSV